MARKYEKVKALLPAVQQLQAEGKTRKEIAKELGLQSERTVKDLLFYPIWNCLRNSTGDTPVTV